MIIRHATEQRPVTEHAVVSGLDRFPTAALSEEEAIAGAQRGDASAFERIYQLHGARVYALCLRMVGNPAEAEDLTQETFLLVLLKIGELQSEFKNRPRDIRNLVPRGLGAPWRTRQSRTKRAIKMQVKGFDRTPSHDPRN